MAAKKSKKRDAQADGEPAAVEGADSNDTGGTDWGGWFKKILTHLLTTGLAALIAAVASYKVAEAQLLSAQTEARKAAEEAANKKSGELRNDVADAQKSAYTELAQTVKELQMQFNKLNGDVREMRGYLDGLRSAVSTTRPLQAPPALSSQPVKLKPRAYEDLMGAEWRELKQPPRPAPLIPPK